MKKNLLYLFSMICMLSFFTSCSDDDEVEFIGTELDGVYKGTLDIDLSGTSVGQGIPQKVYITKVGDNQIKMELKNFSYGTLLLGDISVDKCDVIKKGNTCTFSGTQKLTLPSIGDCDVKVEGSTIDDKITMVINVDASQDGTSIKVNVDFAGTKMVADQSSEAKITEFTFESKLVTLQPIIDSNKITFIVTDTATNEQIAALIPTITISAGATITPESGQTQDFTKPVIYTVVSEDGITITKYTVSIAGGSIDYAFDEWTVDKTQSDEKNQYPIAVGWASCNQAVMMIKALGITGGIDYTGPYPVKSTNDIYTKTGLAAEMTSVDTKGGTMLGQAVPKVTAGTLFLGNFNTFAALGGALKSTEFGIIYDKKPLKVTGYFKYIPGTEFYNNLELDPNGKDECAISAVLYEVKSEKETLDGTNIYNDERIVAMKQFFSGETKNYTPFELGLDYMDGKVYDPSKKYKFTVILAASKEGAAYKAAIGSVLTVDNLTIINEK